MKNKFSFLLVFLLVLTLSFISAGTLKVTEEHPFLIDGEWIPASELEVGDELTLINGSKVVIKNIEDFEMEEPFPVYNLEAGEFHNFVVCGEEDCTENDVGVVVHNSNVAIKQNYYTRDKFKRLIGLDSDEPLKNLFSEAMGDQAYITKPTPGNYKESVKSFAEIAKEMAVIKGDTVKAEMIEMGLKKFEGGMTAGATVSYASSKKGFSQPLFNRIKNNLFENPLNKKFVSIGELPDGTETRVFLRTYFLKGESLQQRIEYDVIKGEIKVIHLFNQLNPRLGSTKIHAHLESLWNIASNPSRSSLKRAKALAEFEWYFMNNNPFGRSGAVLGDGLSMAISRSAGFKLRNTFGNLDFEVLSRTLEEWMKIRPEQLLGQSPIVFLIKILT